HDLLVVSDSDMRVDPEFLHRLVSPLRDDGVGLVGTLPVYVAAEGPAGRALQVYAHLFSLCFGAAIADLDLPGKFAAGNQALRRDLAEALDGFEALGPFLTEDVRLAEAARAGGRRVVYAAMADVPVGRPSRDEVVETLTRYLLGSRAMSLPLFVFTCLLNLGHWLTPVAGAVLGRVELLAVGLLPVLVRVGVAWSMHRRWAGPCGLGEKACAALTLDALFLLAMVRVVLRRPVSWRGVRYRVDTAGRVRREDGLAGGENATA
ncbi:MAG TPA: glycosyltransferase, partial [Bacillota bacterium]